MATTKNLLLSNSSLKTLLFKMAISEQEKACYVLEYVKTSSVVVNLTLCDFFVCVGGIREGQSVCVPTFTEHIHSNYSSGKWRVIDSLTTPDIRKKCMAWNGFPHRYFPYHGRGPYRTYLEIYLLYLIRNNIVILSF